MLAGRYRARWMSAPAAAVILVICAGALLTLPEYQVAAMTGRQPLLLRDSIGFDPGYYTNWFEYAARGKSSAQYEAWFWDVGPRQRERARISSLGIAPGRTLEVIGPVPWLYMETDLLPASPYLNATDLWGLSAAKERVRRDLRDGCADIVVVDTDLAKWQDDINAGGYVPVDGTPWPTFQLTRPSGCRSG
jgi:hypothetical protein